MAKDAVATMGGLLPDDAGGRDAVHVAVFAAVSEEKLKPGQDIGIDRHGETDTKVSSKGTKVAIVDPFLARAVLPGERFWAYLYPRTITSLSHRWGHPAFENTATAYTNPSSKLAAEQWIKDYIDHISNGPSYEVLLRTAATYIDSGDTDENLHFGEDASGEISREFWEKIETVLGKKSKHRPEYFSCAC
jgi:hypothetical protein